MKRGKKKIHYSNRFIYFLITLGILAILAGGVYAISSSGTNSGHPASDIDFSSGVASPLYSTVSIAGDNPATYSQASLYKWGLGSQGMIYVEPAAGKNLYLTDAWSKTGTLDIQFAKTVIDGGQLCLGTSCITAWPTSSTGTQLTKGGKIFICPNYADTLGGCAHSANGASPANVACGGQIVITPASYTYQSLTCTQYIPTIVHGCTYNQYPCTFQGSLVS
jgi:hypothetical protein